MDFFDQHKALIITLLLIGILLLGLYNFSLSSNNQKAREFLVDLENFRTEEPEQPETESQEALQQPTSSSVQTHRAYNQNQEERESNFDRQLEEIFNKNSALKEEASETEAAGNSGNYSLPASKPQQDQQRSDGNNSTLQNSRKSGGMDDSSISYSLQGRSAINIPNPVYTCDRAGKVVVNITVNSQGRVVSTSINKGSSTSSNECLTEQAQEYAAGAVFSRLPGRDSQPGTITYRFKP